MSYTPTIIVRKSDLEKHRDTIENAEYVAVEKESFRGPKAKERKQHLIEAYAALHKALEYPTVKFPELEFVIIYSNETTSENGRLRQLLDDLKIEYKLDD